MSSEEQEEKTSLPPEEQAEETDVKKDPEDAVTVKTEVEVPDCPVHSVVVYPDRAEVCWHCMRLGLSLMYVPDLL